MNITVYFLLLVLVARTCLFSPTNFYKIIDIDVNDTDFTDPYIYNTTVERIVNRYGVNTLELKWVHFMLIITIPYPLSKPSRDGLDKG